MKKLIAFTLLLIVYSFSYSCEKEPCWRCCTFTRTTTEGSSATTTTTSEVDTCGLSERQMRSYSKANTKTVTSVVNGVTVTTISNCNCLVISYL